MNLFVHALLTIDAAALALVGHTSKICASRISMMSGGKGFGGGEATRDPMPTAYDPNDPKGKQQAIHKAESFADYLARRQGGVPAAAPAPVPVPAPPPTAPAAYVAPAPAPAAPAAPAPVAFVPPPAPAPAPPAAPVAAPVAKEPEVSPWDTDLALVTLMVDGKPKLYRIKS